MGRSKSAANAMLEYEAGQEFVAFDSPLTNSGDNQKFSSPDGLWSGFEGKEPVVRPNGLISGGVITPGAANEIAVSAAKAYIEGELVEVAGVTDLAISRGADTDTHRINSVVVKWHAGSSAYTFQIEANAAHTEFVAGRGANAGQAALIGVDDIEVGMLYLTTVVSAIVSLSEIFQVPGVHQERYDYPIWDEDWVNGEITFAAALPTIHTGPAPKRTYAQYYTPIMVEQQNAADFVPSEMTHSISSTPVYGGAVGSSSASINQATFTARLQNGVTDNILKQKNKTIWTRFFPDKYDDSKYLLTQGKLGVSRTFPAGDNIQANFTLSSSQESEEVGT